MGSHAVNAITVTCKRKCNIGFLQLLLTAEWVQKFCKGGGGVNLGYFIKRGHCCKQHQGEHWKTMFKN